MDLNIKEKINELVDKIKNDKDIAEKFKNEPVKTVEELIGVDLPDDKLRQVVDGIKAKIAVGSIGEKLGGLFGKK